MNASGVDNHTLSASVRLSATAGNQIATQADGLYVAAFTQTALSPVSTNSVILAGSGTAGHTLQADVRIDPAAGKQNAITMSAAGVRVAPTRKTRVVAASGSITAADTVVIVNNGTTNITLTMSGTFDPDHGLSISRAAGSTGTVTIAAGTTGHTFQALNGTVGATTSIAAHNGAGAGVSSGFVLSGTVWYRAV